MQRKHEQLRLTFLDERAQRDDLSVLFLEGLQINPKKIITLPLIKRNSRDSKAFRELKDSRELPKDVIASREKES